MENSGNMYVLDENERITAPISDPKTGKWPVTTIYGPCIVRVEAQAMTASGNEISLQVTGGKPITGRIYMKAPSFESTVHKK
ncbi:hypothetical protein KBB12_03200 [Candidatus Woesebacteria bacterium]|nr:hypothetical protein [Candidatus Woesebacteria bacterium]